MKAIPEDRLHIFYTAMSIALVLLGLLYMCGCSRFSSTVTATDAKGAPVSTKVTAWTFFDSQSALSKFLAHQTTKTNGVSAQSIGLASLDQESSGTNAVELIRAASEGLAKGIVTGIK